MSTAATTYMTACSVTTLSTRIASLPENLRNNPF